MIQEVYEGVEITLREDENNWAFTVNGRSRTAATLPKAREAIDRSLDAVEKKVEAKFEPISVYYLPSYVSDGDIGTLTKGRITSVTDETDYDKLPKVWVTTERRGREKKSISYLCVDSPANIAVFEELEAIQKEINSGKERLRQVGAKIERVTLPKVE